MLAYADRIANDMLARKRSTQVRQRREDYPPDRIVSLKQERKAQAPSRTDLQISSNSTATVCSNDTVLSTTTSQSLDNSQASQLTGCHELEEKLQSQKSWIQSQTMLISEAGKKVQGLTSEAAARKEDVRLWREKLASIRREVTGLVTEADPEMSALTSKLLDRVWLRLEGAQAMLDETRQQLSDQLGYQSRLKSELAAVQKETSDCSDQVLRMYEERMTAIKAIQAVCKPN